MSPRERIACAAALFVGWGALVVLGSAPVNEFVSAIRDALIALGVFTATSFDPKE